MGESTSSLHWDSTRGRWEYSTRQIHPCLVAVRTHLCGPLLLAAHGHIGDKPSATFETLVRKNQTLSHLSLTVHTKPSSTTTWQQHQNPLPTTVKRNPTPSTSATCSSKTPTLCPPPPPPPAKKNPSSAPSPKNAHKP